MEDINIVGAIIGALAGIVCGGFIGRFNIYNRINKSNLFGEGENPELQAKRGNTAAQKVIIMFVALVFTGIGIFCIFFTDVAMQGATENVSGPNMLRVFGGVALAFAVMLITAVFKQD